MVDYTGTDNLEIMADAVNYNNFLISLVKSEIQANHKVIDFGAGIGTFAKAVVKNASQIHCVEPDARQLARILDIGISASKDLELIDEQSVDVIYSLNVLEHIEDDAGCLKLCHEKIKPNGKILIYVPAFQILYSSMDRKVGHFRRYSRGDLSEKVISAGFRIERSEYVDSAGFFASLLFKFLGDNSGAINRKALVAYDRYVFPLSRLGDNLFRKVFGKNLLIIAKRPMI